MKKKTLAILCAAMCSISTSTFSGGDPVVGKDKAFDCENCHKPDNLGMNPTWPGIAGLNEDYLAKQIRDYRVGTRQHGVMLQMVSRLSEADIDDISAFYAARTDIQSTEARPMNNAGKKVYVRDNTSKGVPSCVACHSADGESNALGGFVKLAGQQQRYLEDQLYAFKFGDRKNDSTGQMRKAASMLKDSEIENVAAYLSGLK